mmetsp:Transcript_18448/g.42719  ORF Transcript_18448/g.42719 Transcript_18448/m.42719 type:complete len:98 (-) Transcript_18448:39-332(-)
MVRRVKTGCFRPPGYTDFSAPKKGLFELALIAQGFQVNLGIMIGMRSLWIHTASINHSANGVFHNLCWAHRLKTWKGNHLVESVSVLFVQNCGTLSL